MHCWMDAPKCSSCLQLCSDILPCHKCQHVCLIAGFVVSSYLTMLCFKDGSHPSCWWIRVNGPAWTWGCGA